MTDRCTQMALMGAGPVGLGMAKALLEHEIPYEELEADPQRVFDSTGNGEYTLRYQGRTDQWAYWINGLKRTS
jgi:cation diffusion facilitator CzcD-associated flavoprotein CzcO